MYSRSAMMAKFQARTDRYDLIIVGGGITGVGVAWQAAAAGHSVLLVERGDLAGGTSSSSTKLIHGGIRYLKQFDLRLVREGVREREELIRLAPALVHPAEFVYPIYKEGAEQLWMLRLGLQVYDWFAGRQNLHPHRIRSVPELLEDEPLLRPDGLQGGARYADCVTDDARLTLAVARAAARAGATILTYAQVTGFQYGEDGRIAGVTLQPEDGESVTVAASHVLNATGPWVDQVRRLDQPGARPLLRPTKGVHLTVERERLPLHHPAVLFGPDGRLMFGIPRGARTYLGTTDTDWAGDPGDLGVDRNDVTYILTAANHAFPGARLAEADVRSVWAGLRPLVAASDSAGPSQLSRDYRVIRSATGLYSVAGGKLTAFRAMAHGILRQTGLVDRSGSPAAEVALSADHPTTQTLPVDPFSFPEEPDWSPEAIADAAVWSVQEGFAHHLSDLLARRTGQLLWAPGAGLTHVERAATAMGALLGWTEAERLAEVATYQQLVARMDSWRH
jgi:glycerol-3-phosphate dehydrogenase